eukprot:358692-Chlamydomonas_euryale.AAC.6
MGLQPPLESLRGKEVQGRGQRAALPDPCLIGHHRRSPATHIRHSTRRCEKGTYVCPLDEALTSSHGLHSIVQKVRIQQVIGLGDVEEKQRCSGRSLPAWLCVGHQQVGKELEQHDVVADPPPWQKRLLVGANCQAKGRAQAHRQDLGQDAVFRVEQRDKAPGCSGSPPGSGGHVTRSSRQPELEPVLPTAEDKRASRLAMVFPRDLQSWTGMSFGPGARPGLVDRTAAWTSATETSGAPARNAASEATRMPWVATAAKTWWRGAAKASRRAETDAKCKAMWAATSRKICYCALANTQPLNRPGPQPWRPKTPINRTLAEEDRHVLVRNEDQGWSADAR